MAFEIVNNDVSIEFIMDSNVCIGINIDVSRNIERGIVLFDVLLEDKAKSIYLCDSNKGSRVLIQKGNNNVLFDSKIVITLSDNNIEIIKNMLLDVAVGMGFLGYHYDIDMSTNVPFELCFKLK